MNVIEPRLRLSTVLLAAVASSRNSRPPWLVSVALPADEFCVNFTKPPLSTVGSGGRGAEVIARFSALKAPLNTSAPPAFTATGPLLRAPVALASIVPSAIVVPPV
ncbi:MAG: hypothetical protein EOO28_30225 [Comamonadaceae bacterium]|nr:MAG: hypothetical protein EOO28_30225 [Comamonadaceae bacterium]